jgi:medium-chain acyl-[acyl-carrier-protein] hydrolase
MTAEPIYTQTYDVNTIVLDHQKRLSLVGMLNVLQDIAWMHASRLGWGYDDLITKGTIWVLSRQKLVITDWPVWEDKVTIHTWPRRSGSIVALREFEIRVGDKKVGECTTSWIVLDWNTRKVQKLDRIMSDMPLRTEGMLEISAERIVPRNDLREVARFHVRNSDLDVNGHVNNTRYGQWITDAMTTDDLAKYSIDEYEVNFLAETGVGDAVLIEADEGTPGADGRIVRQYQGRKTGEDKPAFAARLVLVPR